MGGDPWRVEDHLEPDGRGEPLLALGDDLERHRSVANDGHFGLYDSQLEGRLFSHRDGQAVEGVVQVDRLSRVADQEVNTDTEAAADVF